MIRFDDNSKLKESEAFGINGSLVDIGIVKSRTARAGQAATMVFDQELGFDADLSLFLMLKDAGKVKGAGAYLYLGDRDDMKFSQRQFKDKLSENEEFRKLFVSEVQEVLKSIVESGPELVESNYHDAADDIMTEMSMVA